MHVPLPGLVPAPPAQQAARPGQVEQRGLAGENVVPGRQQPPLLPKLPCRVPKGSSRWTAAGGATGRAPSVPSASSSVLQAGRSADSSPDTEAAGSSPAGRQHHAAPAPGGASRQADTPTRQRLPGRARTGYLRHAPVSTSWKQSTSASMPCRHCRSSGSRSCQRSMTPAQGPRQEASRGWGLAKRQALQCSHRGLAVRWGCTAAQTVVSWTLSA